MGKIRIGILGYGNLGKGVEQGIKQNPDMELVGIFTRRDPSIIETNSAAYRESELENFKGKIDVLALCVGSANDLPELGPKYLKWFNTVDTYDNHDEIPEYIDKLDKIGKEHKKLAVVGTGWDPGLFSRQRILAQSLLPNSKIEAFYGPGKSLGHSDAIRNLDGVIDAVQYTLPNLELIEAIKEGSILEVNPLDKHKRDCYVVIEDNADKDLIKEQIINMEGYFKGQETMVNFVTLEELEKNHNSDAHQGLVLCIGETANGSKGIIELKVAWESNASATAGILLATARATHRLAKEGETGVLTVLDIPDSYLSIKTKEEQIKLI